MRFLALFVALIGLGAGVFAVAVDIPKYEDARSEWMRMGNNYNHPSYDRISEARDRYFSRVETEGVVAIGAALLGLILGFVARRRDGGLPATLAIVASLGAGACGGIIATTPGIF